MKWYLPLCILLAVALSQPLARKKIEIQLLNGRCVSNTIARDQGSSLGCRWAVE